MTTSASPEPSWSDRAWKALIALADSGEPFTADDLIDLVGVPDERHRANGRNSQVGSLFRAAAVQGYIITSNYVVASRRPERRGGTQRVWRGV